MRFTLPVRCVRAGLLLLAMAASCWAMAQGRFTINGKLRVEGGSMAGSRMVVYKNGEKHRTVSTDLNRFSLELDLDASYVLSFEKDGFVTKKLLFNTKVPAAARSSTFGAFDFVVSLFKQYDGVNIVVFNQPVGMIRYSAALGDFDYDTDYTKSIQSALEAAQAETLQKQKEEARKEAEAKKREEQEAKAQAKAAKALQAQEEKKAPPAPVKKEAAPPAPDPPVVTESAPPKERHVPLATGTVRKAALVGTPIQGGDTRRTASPQMGQDPSPVQMARARMEEEPRPVREPAITPVVRHQDVIVQPNEVVTIIRVENGELVTEYRRVSRKYSGVFYFKDGKSCSRLTYEQEALADN